MWWQDLLVRLAEAVAIIGGVGGLQIALSKALTKSRAQRFDAVDEKQRELAAKVDIINRDIDSLTSQLAVQAKDNLREFVRQTTFGEAMARVEKSMDRLDGTIGRLNEHLLESPRGRHP